jgi:hypothetical protein
MTTRKNQKNERGTQWWHAALSERKVVMAIIICNFCEKFIDLDWTVDGIRWCNKCYKPMCEDCQEKYLPDEWANDELDQSNFVCPDCAKKPEK